MTIVIGVATPEGLVLASDSRTTSMGGSRHHRVASDNMQKIFVVDGIGVATFGDAFIGSDTIAGVMDQFAAQCVPEHTEDVDAFSSALGDFFDERFRQHKELQLLAIERSRHTWVASLDLAAPSQPGSAEDPAR